MSLEALGLELEIPHEFESAPAWAQLLYLQNRQIVSKIGIEPKADGTGGSGLLGQVAQLDRRLRPFESLKDKAWGAGVMALLLLGALWWLLQDRIAALLKPHG